MPNTWSSAVQNVFALLVTCYLAKEQIIRGEMASVMILAILGVIAIPAFKGGRGGGTGSIGVFALLGWPVVRIALALSAAKGA